MARRWRNAMAWHGMRVSMARKCWRNNGISRQASYDAWRHRRVISNSLKRKIRRNGIWHRIWHQRRASAKSNERNQAAWREVGVIWRVCTGDISGKSIGGAQNAIGESSRSDAYRALNIVGSHISHQTPAPYAPSSTMARRTHAARHCKHSVPRNARCARIR